MLRIVLLVISIGSMAGGGALWLAERGSAESTPAPSTAPATQASRSGFLPTSDGPAPSEPTEQAAGESSPPTYFSSWSGGLFRFGFSFLVGFCIAYALRTVFKLAAIAIGLILLAFFGLQYLGVLEIDWSAIAGRYDSVADWFAVQFESFHRFVTGLLPSAGMLTAGAATGLTRR